MSYQTITLPAGSCGEENAREPDGADGRCAGIASNHSSYIPTQERRWTAPGIPSYLDVEALPVKELTGRAMQEGGFSLTY